MDRVINEILGFMMVLTRISAFFLVVPVFSWMSIPQPPKVMMVLLLSIFFYMVFPISPGVDNVTVLESVLLLTNEMVYGLALGLIVALLFSAVKLAGNIMEQQMGLTMGSILDPMTGEEAESVSLLLEMIFILMFFAAGGHHLFLLIMSRSYEVFPAGTTPTLPVICEGVIHASSVMLTAGLRISAPLLGVFMILMVVLAVLARIVPEMNIFFISPPIQIGIGMIMIAIFLPFINGYISEFAEWMGKLLPV